MMPSTGETHDPSLRSWVESANEPGNPFPIQNLPFGLFRIEGSSARAGVAIGDHILDLQAAAIWTETPLNGLMASGPECWRELRLRLSRGLRTGSGEEGKWRRFLLPRAAAEMLLPAAIGDYTDFYASVQHASRVGALFRPDQPLLPNYKYVPIAYHGRASSVVISGTPVRRPCGQTPEFGPTRALDYEAELAFFMGPGTRLGEPVSIGGAHRHIFGYCLLNDWSARDMQRWEYQPLGPFLAKNFATSISPWIVTSEALEPFRAAIPERAHGDPQPLPYLFDPSDQNSGALEIRIEVWLSTAAMKRAGQPAVLLSSANAGELYWSPAQMVTHHASNGCNLRPGDLLASGTVSGAAADSAGCLLERTAGGAEPVRLPSGESRTYLEDGDEVILRGWCRRDGYASIGFGECSGVILPAQGG